ncbi:hypothetical protein ACJMQP_07540 [Rhodopseudomonas palustris]
MSNGNEKMPPRHNWTAEKLAALDTVRLRTLRQNAIRLDAADLTELCDAALAARVPQRQAANRAYRQEVGDIVTEYHFVCRNDRGVTFNPDGSFWTASWVVAEGLLKRSMNFGAKLALHNSKLEPSYRQGLIKEYRLVDDFAEGEVESRIDFLVVPDTQSLDWVGAGRGEKGYKRAKTLGGRVVANDRLDDVE